MALSKKRIKDLAEQILEDSTDSDDATEFCDSFRSIIYSFEEDHNEDLTMEDRAALFAECMKTFNNPEENAVYPIGFIRGLAWVCEVPGPITLTITM